MSSCISVLQRFHKSSGPTSTTRIAMCSPRQDLNRCYAAKVARNPPHKGQGNIVLSFGLSFFTAGVADFFLPMPLQLPQPQEYRQTIRMLLHINRMHIFKVATEIELLRSNDASKQRSWLPLAFQVRERVRTSAAQASAPTSAHSR
jgi:hypothetical protein